MNSEFCDIELEPPAGHTFKPSLQDISLKRFRMRYCVNHNCYYLHWDNTVCPQLARIDGLKNGVYSMEGMKRYQDEDKAYLSCENGQNVGEIHWKFDFSDCGLVVSGLQLKARWAGESDNGITWTISGDNGVKYTTSLGDYHVELPELAKNRVVTLTATVTQESDANPLQLLAGSVDQPDDCPLDIIIDLMCARREDEQYIGELLLGLKFTPEDTGDDLEEGMEELVVNGDSHSGQLQVHVVEGAGLFDDESRKPFNAFVKCDILPDSGRYSGKQTSPRHNAYPTWAKEFVFNGLTKADLVIGGLEVLLYDYHRVFSDVNIGGIRLSVPVRSNTIATYSPSSSPLRIGSNSPAELTLNGLDDLLRAESPNLPTSSPNLSPRHKARSLPFNHYSSTDHTISSPISLSPIPQRAHSPSPKSPNTLSPIPLRRERSVSPSRSPIIAAKNFFRLSGSHLKDSSSPRASPILGRRKFLSRGMSRGNSTESEFIFGWMDSTGQEVKQWQQVLDNEKKWIYCWHALRPKLKPAYS